MPLVLNPVPVVLTWLIVTVLDPEFVSVMFCCPVPPTATLLKLTLAGFADSVPLVATALPLKVND